MKRCSFGWAAWAVLMACFGSFCAQAAPLAFDLFRGELTLLNNTPFNLKVRRNSMVTDQGRTKSTFTFSDEFKARDHTIAPGELSYLGYDESEGNEVEGRFTFRFVETNRIFDALYRFATNSDHDTWFTLNNFEDKSIYPLISVHMVRSCDVKKGLIPGTRYDHTCTIRLSMDDDAIACVGDPDCSSRAFLEAQKYRKKGEL